MSKLTLASAADDITAVLDTLDGIEDVAAREQAEVEMRPMIERAVRKVDSFAAYLRGIDADISKIEHEIKSIEKANIARLRKRKAAFEKRRERLSQYAMWVIGEREKLEGSLNTLAIRNNPERVVIDDAAQIPERFTRVTVEMSGESWSEIERALIGVADTFGGSTADELATKITRDIPLSPIADALKAKERVPGARLVRDKRLEVA